MAIPALVQSSALLGTGSVFTEYWGFANAPQSASCFTMFRGGSSTLSFANTLTQTNVSWSLVTRDNSSRPFEHWKGVQTGPGSPGQWITASLVSNTAGQGNGNLAEWSGLPGGVGSSMGQFTQTLTNAATSTTPTTTTVTPPIANYSVLVASYRGGNASAGPTNGWTALPSSSANTPAAYKIVSGSTNQSTSWTSANATYTVVIAGYQGDVTSSIAGPTPNRFSIVII